MFIFGFSAWGFTSLHDCFDISEFFVSDNVKTAQELTEILIANVRAKCTKKNDLDYVYVMWYGIDPVSLKMDNPILFKFFPTKRYTNRDFKIMTYFPDRCARCEKDLEFDENIVISNPNKKELFLRRVDDPTGSMDSCFAEYRLFTSYGKLLESLWDDEYDIPIWVMNDECKYMTFDYTKMEFNKIYGGKYSEWINLREKSNDKYDVPIWDM